ncbi:MAG TPA: hypothetical protein DD441_12115 [Parabacteroides distasonis]|nr:hypothetical protein [Parabacteroides distasonis]
MFSFPLLGDKKISLRYARNTMDLPCIPSLIFMCCLKKKTKKQPLSLLFIKEERLSLPCYR